MSMTGTPRPIALLLLGGDDAEPAFDAIGGAIADAADVSVSRGPADDARIVIAHGSEADAILHSLAQQSSDLSHLALLHPRQAAMPTELAVDGVSVLITAGATDPGAPAERIGALADTLDAAGAKTEVHWNRGGAEIAEAEIEHLLEWLNGARASLADPSTLPVEREEDGGKGRYIMAAPGGVLAEMSYSRANDGLIIIDHTEVPPAFRGTGTGLRLLRHLIADARAAGVKIIPLCPYAKAQFDRHAEWADVLEKRVRLKPQRAPEDR